MKKKILRNSLLISDLRIFQYLILILVSLLICPESNAQETFTMVDAKHNKAISVYYSWEVYHKNNIFEEEKNWDFPTYWSFIPIPYKGEQYYEIHSTQYPANSLAVPLDENSRDIWFGPAPSNPNEYPERHLWKLEKVLDTAGLGIRYRIVNAYYPQEILGGGVNYNGKLYNYHEDKSLDIGEQCYWRLFLRGYFPNSKGVVPAGFIQSSVKVVQSENKIKTFIYGLPGSCESPQYWHTDGLQKPSELKHDTIYVPRNSPIKPWSRVQSRLIYPVSFYFEHPDNQTLLIPPTLSDTCYNPYNPSWSGNSKLKINISKRIENSPSQYIGKLKYSVPYGTTTLLNSIDFVTADQNNAFSFERLAWPALVSGPVDSAVQVINTYKEPLLPIMVLHDPPGDKSFSEFNENKKICRQTETTISSSQQHDLNTSVKLGYKGKIGFIVGVDVEFYAKWTMMGSKGSLNIETSSKETCIETSEKFSTSDFGAGGNDLFIGYGRTVECGIGNIISFDPSDCNKITTSKQLYIAPVGEPLTFAYTEDKMKTEIENLSKIWKDSIQVGNRASKEALFQMNTFKKVLELNNANKIEAAKDTSQFTFTGDNTKREVTNEVKVTRTTSMETEQFLALNTGFEFLVDIGGTGGSTGYNFKTERKFGATASQGVEISQMLTYTLQDDNPSDDFIVNIGKDPQFGTPVFNLNTKESKTSCPYEGGFQLDQPKLKDPLTGNNEMSLTGIPNGKDAIFKINVCNDSKEARDYNLKLNENSNANLNASVIAGGSTINNNPNGRTYKNLIPGNCIEVEIIVRQQILSRLDYPNLELTLTPACSDEANISSSLFLSAFFDKNVATKDQLKESSILNLSPNPSSDIFYLEFNLKEKSLIHFDLISLLGRKSDMSFVEEFSEGNHIKKFNVHTLPSGIYLFSIRTNDALLTRKLVIEH